MTTQRRWAAPPLGPLAVIGVGQIGGSFALGARAAGAVGEVVGWSRNPSTVARAKDLGVVDRAAASAAEAVRGAAVVVLATPVRSLGPIAKEIAPLLTPSAVVLDVGSVKVGVLRAVEGQLPRGAFVPCHPLAGTERSGPDAASPLLFEGRRCVICPTAATRPEAVATVEQLWRALGAEPVRMDAALHDRVLAAGSHLPHVTAYALAGVLGRLGPDQVDALKRLPTTSLRDTTRVAASSPVMWRDILLDNRDQVLPLVKMLQAEIEALHAAIDAGDGEGIEALLGAGKAGRDRIIPG